MGVLWGSQSEDYIELQDVELGPSILQATHLRYSMIMGSLW